MAKVKNKISRQTSDNLSLQIWYRNELLKMVREMSKKTEKELLKAWKGALPKIELEAKQAEGEPMANDSMQDACSPAGRAKQKSHVLQARASVRQEAVPSGIAYDSSPAVELTKVIKRLRNYFNTHFQEMEEKVSKKFASLAEKGAAVSLKSILKEEGFTVDFRMTRQLNDILQATVAENVNLIKSIHTMYFDQVQTVIMQAVKNGRDMEYIRKELTERFGVSERKAKIIARDQTNKAMQTISRARALETGITQARWVHIPGAKTSRETHKHFDGKPFDLNKGMYDKDVNKWVMPGELINCNCRFRLIVPSVEK